MKNAVDAVVTPETIEVVETAVVKSNMLTPKRLMVAAAVTVGVVGTVFVVRHFRKTSQEKLEEVFAKVAE